MSPTRAQLATAKGWTLQGINAWKRPSLPADAQEAGTGQENVAVMESLEHTSNKAPRESSIPIPQNTKRIPKQQGKGSVVSLELLQKCITKWKYVTRKSRSRTDCLVQELQTRQLMKRFLTRWIEEARHVSTLKWRETVRAQVVYRYKTLDRVWRAWKLVKRQRALQADQMSQAAELYTRTQKRRGLQHWLMYCEHRRDVEQVKERALSLRLTNLVRRHIRNWNSKTLVNSERRESEEQALEIAHRSRLCSAFYAWKGCHDLAEYWKAQERFGDQMYQETLLARSFVHWNVQWQLKETLAWHDDNATVFYNRTRVAHCLHTWKVMHLQHQVTANQMELAEWTYRRRVLTLLTRKWRTKTLESLKNDLLEENVVNYRQVMIKKRFVEQLVQMRRDVAVADFAYCFGKMRGAFLEWKQLASFKAFIRDQKESHKGIAFYHSKLKILALKQWNEYIHQTRQKNTRVRLARDTRIRRVQTHYLAIMRQKFTRLRAEKDLYEKAQTFYRNKLLTWMWSSWYRHQLFVAQEKEQLKVAQIHFNVTLCRNAVSRLKENAFDAQAERYNMECAQVQHNRKITQTAINHWVVYTNQQLKKSDLKRRAIRQWYRYRIWSSWDMWQHRLVSLTQDRVRQKLMDVRYDQITLRNHFAAWKDYIQAKNSLVKAIENLEYRRVFRSLRTHFETWRARNKTREMNACNIWHMRKTIGDNQCRFVLYKWKLALNTRRVEQQAEDDWVFCIRKELDLSKLSRALSGLKTYFEHRLAKRQLQESANAFRNATTQTRSMQKWRLIFRHKRWVNAVNVKALTLLKKRTLLPAFRHWATQRKDWKAIYKRNNMEPLAFYQGSVLKKLIAAWRRFNQEEKAFKSLVEKAKQDRIDQLIHNGLRAWLSIAEEADKSKFELALRRFPDFQPRTLVAARKCGIIWRQKAKSSQSSLSSLSRFQRDGRRSLHTERLLMSVDIPRVPSSDERAPDGKRKAPRKPAFLMDVENRIVEIVEELLPLKPAVSQETAVVEIPLMKEASVGPSRKAEISIQTDPEVSTPTSAVHVSHKRQEVTANIDRQDSGIDVNAPIPVGTEATLVKSGSMLALERILSNIPQEPLTAAVVEKPRPAMGVQEIESKLLAFQALKSRYLQNKKRIGHVQLEIHDMLFGRTGGDLDTKTQELEKIRQQVKEYEDSADSRNQEIILLSMQIQYFLSNSQQKL